MDESNANDAEGAPPTVDPTAATAANYRAYIQWHVAREIRSWVRRQREETARSGVADETVTVA